MYNDTKKDSIAKIKVIGVGGGGNNAVNRMIQDGLENVEFLLVNTEQQIFKKAKTNNIIQIGKEVTKGLGAGANAEVGERAAMESEEEIRKALIGVDLVFLTAGMGGGTGTGALPVIAKIAKDMGILTVAIVTKPFTFEGMMRAKRAEQGIEKLKQNVDALIVVLNNNLLRVNNARIELTEAFSLADDVLKQAVQGITDLIVNVGDINTDFADIRTIMGYNGTAYMGIGVGKGEYATMEATVRAIDNPLTEANINGARGVIINIRGGSELGLTAINNSVELINEKVDEDANIIFGTTIDEDLDDQVIVTVIATGLENKRIK